MPNLLDASLERWVKAGLIDPAAAERIRAHEAGQEKHRGLRWPVLLALAFGAVLIGSGILLFISAHWDDLAPGSRFALALLLVAAFHVAGALTEASFPAAATTFHALGTIALGGGIFLTGQIFNLQEHWPGGVMVWAAGAWIGWWLRRDWPHATLAAILTPVWLSGEWISAANQIYFEPDRLFGQWTVLLALVYLGARSSELGGPVRRALAWCGGLALIPSIGMMWAVEWSRLDIEKVSSSMRLAGWIGGMGIPLLLGWLLRRRDAWVFGAWAVWVIGFGQLAARHPSESVWQHLWLALGCVALAYWGVRERRSERINLGVVGFALTVLSFYFSSLMDKLGRSASLVGLGLIFLIGGWLLERLRRRLVAGIRGEA